MCDECAQSNWSHLYDGTVHDASYVYNTEHQFFAQLTATRKIILFSIKILQPAIETQLSFEALRKVFNRHIISHGL